MENTVHNKKEKYICNFGRHYYQIRSLTLWDFRTNTVLEAVLMKSYDNKEQFFHQIDLFMSSNTRTFVPAQFNRI